MRRVRYILLLLLIIVSFCLFPTMGAKAASWPAKPVTIVIPWGAGSLSFMLAQLIGDEMGKILDQRFLVVAKPGGSGATGSLFVKNSLKEFVDYVKKNPNRIFKFGSGGAMSLHSIYGNEVFHNAGVKVQGIYYQASSKALPDLVGGNLDVGFSTFMSLARFEELKAIGVFASERIPEFKDVPTVKEQGLEAPVTMAWSGFAAPAGLPPEVREKLVSTLQKVLTNEEVKKRIFKNLNQFVVYHGPGDFKGIIERDLKSMRTPVERIMERQKKK